MDLRPWGPDRAADLAALLGSALPGERLDPEDLLAVCWADGEVLATADGGAVVAVKPGEAAAIRALAVRPDRRRRGLGRALLHAAEDRCFEAGASTVQLGGEAPFYVWPGVDLRWTPAMVLAETEHYRRRSVELNLRVPTGADTRPAPPGVIVECPAPPSSVDGALVLAARAYPNWVPELRRGAERGVVATARTADGVIAFGCHSVNRRTWIGPMATDPDGQHRGTGSAVLGALLADLAARDEATAEIAWVSTVAFYARSSGAEVDRAFAVWVRSRRSWERRRAGT